MHQTTLTPTRPIKYWLVVVSRDHVQIGKRLGIVQANHGKAAPMKRLKAGDMIVFYSPKVAFGGDEPLQKFTAVARVKEGEVYQGDMGGGFVLYRRDVEYVESEEADIRPLIEKLSFIEDKTHWGYMFRFGFFEIPEKDYSIIAHAMEVA